MVNQSRDARELDRAFRALGDATRRGIVERLTHGEASLGELAQPLEMSLPAVLKHLRVLEAAGLVRTRKEGRVRRCRLEPRPLSRAVRWMETRQALWQRRLARLDAHLAEEKLQ